MQNLLEKQLTINDIVRWYKEGESESHFIGLEYERISLDNKSFLQADFKNLYKIIEDFSKENNFELIYDNETIIGAKNDAGTSISLEPGGQFEISLAPKNHLYEIHFLMNDYIQKLDNLGEKYNVKFFSIGSNPKCCYQNMEILNKRRYKLMANYLPKIGKFAPIMMRETAGVQVNIDYENELDCKRKIKTAALMSPFLTGFFANSPFRNNKLTNYKSIRALAWKYTGYDRCNLFYKGIIDNDAPLYEQYAQYILDVPMIFIKRDGKYINLDGKLSFRQFMERGYLGYEAEFEDYIIHQSLCFPDVRLKNCIEIRNHDSQNLEVAIGIAAIYKGILYNKDAMDAILKFLSPLNSYDLNHLGYQAAKFGINFEVKKLNCTAYEVVQKIILFAQAYLNKDDSKYLDWLYTIAKNKKCIADIVLENVR